MSKATKLFTILLRICVGWIFLYQGIVAWRSSSWTVLSYIKNSKIFPGVYAYISQPSILVPLNYTVKSLFIIIGLFLILGLFVRIVSLLGALLTLFFYLPTLRGLTIGGSYLIIDDQVIMILVLLYLFAIRAGEFFGLGRMFHFLRY